MSDEKNSNEGILDSFNRDYEVVLDSFIEKDKALSMCKNR